MGTVSGLRARSSFLHTGESKMVESTRRSNVIQLKIKPTGRYCEPLNLRFPAIFRLTGFYWEQNASGQMVANENEPVMLYTLSDNPDDTEKIAKPVFTLINHLDPSIDDGVLIIRRHFTESIAEGYVAGVIDRDMGQSCQPPDIYRTETGVFTLLHRRPRVGAENHLIAFYASFTVVDEWFGIVRSDGSWHPKSESLLYPDEDED